MATSIDRPFENFRAAITDPDYFFGRSEFLKQVQQSPFQVRILLGGRRLGKTSALRAAEWTLLNHKPDNHSRAFPVIISLKTEQPKNLDNFRYLLIVRLREAMSRWQQTPGASLREMYQQYLRQVSSGAS